MTDPAYRQTTVRTCSRRWLRVKLHFLVTRDEEGMKEFNALLENVAGRRIGVVELMLATLLFVGDGTQESTLMAVLFAYLCVPFWQWRKLHSLFKMADAQLS